MAKNVAEELQEKAQNLFEKLASSHQVANLIMGIIGKIVWECANKNKPIEGVRIAGIINTQSEVRFKVHYGSVPIMSMGIWKMGGDMINYINGRSSHLANAIHRNPGLIKSLTDIVETLDRRATQKGKQFKEVSIKKAFVTHEDVFVVVTGKNDLDKWGR